MPSPKLQRIVDEIIRRVSQITMQNGYVTDIGLRVFVDNRPPQEDAVPCVVVGMQERTVESFLNCAAKTTMTITVTGYDRIGHVETYQRGIDILSDIQTAVENEDMTLDRLLMGSEYGLSFASDNVGFPDVGTDVVAGAVSYVAPHIRKLGDPERV